jgi:hypothetical protein
MAQLNLHAPIAGAKPESSMPCDPPMSKSTDHGIDSMPFLFAAANAHRSIQ